MQWQELSTHLRHLPQHDLQRIERAFRMGEKAHAGQKRKSGEPYFTHPIAIAHMLADMGADADTLIAALLHDTLEDTPLRFEEIVESFGQTAGDLIQGVTKLSKADLEKPTLDEQKESLRKIFTLMQGDVRIMVIKIVDRLHNMQTAMFLSEERRKALAQETLDVYVKIADRLCMQDLRDELAGLCLQVLDPLLHEKLSQLRLGNEQAAIAIIDRMRRRMRETHDGVPGTLVLAYEHKSWDKLERQQKLEGAAATGTSDHSVVFVCPDVDACYRVLGFIHQLWHREAGSFQDYINSPLINGYRGVHTTVILDDGTRIRCKIRTEEMDIYARRGIAMVCFSSDTAAMHRLPWIQRLAPLTRDTKDRSEEFWQGLQSDILGESITVYGISGNAADVPVGATALDAAFYLYGELCVRASSVKVNGKEVKFFTPLRHSDTVAIHVESYAVVRREWLSWVRTSLATATIREFLASESSLEKSQIGRDLLQQVFIERRKGYIGEFALKGMDRAALALGYSSLDDACIAIADGRLDPVEFCDAIFETRKSVVESSQDWVVQYDVDPDDLESMDRMNAIHCANRSAFSAIRYSYSARRKIGVFMIRLTATTSRLRFLIAELRQAGARDLDARPHRSRIPSAVGLISIFVLWGIDPVIARLLLTSTTLTAVDLTIFRFWGLFGLSAMFLIVRAWGNDLPQKRLSLRSPDLWTSVVLLFGVAISTYLVLKEITPLAYTIPMTAAGAIRMSSVSRRSIAYWAGWGILIFGVAFLMLRTPFWNSWTTLLIISGVTCFSAFWVFSDRYKLQEQVSARVTQFFFILSFLCALLTVPLLPFSSVFDQPAWTLAAALAFAVCVSSLPYFLTYHVLRPRDIAWASAYSSIVIPITLMAQVLVFRAIDVDTVISAVVVTAGALLLSVLRPRTAQR